MKKDLTFLEYVTQDLLGDMGNIAWRAMFGAYGIYKDVCMFALIADGELYFKVDTNTIEKYREFGSRPFTYMKKEKSQELSYYLIPEEVQENRELFRDLAQQSYELALEKELKRLYVNS